MMLPFVRLLAIYIVVIVAVVAVFQRDRIMALAGWSPDPRQPEIAAAPAAPAAAPAPASPAQADNVQPLSGTGKDQTAPQPAPAVQAAAPAGDDTQNRLNAARQSYWNGDLAGAEALYAALVRDRPDNPDARGEHGNVLYAQRRYGAAAEAYLATGKLLVQAGHPARAMALVNVLQAIAPEKAATLYALTGN